MTHAQMEAFQYLLQWINKLVKPNYILLFKYNDSLMTGKFYKESVEGLPSGIQNLRLIRNSEESQWYGEREITNSHLLFNFINGSRLQDFSDKYNIRLNLKYPEILFMEISQFVSNLEGDPVSQFTYDVKNEESGLKIPFLMTDSNSVFEPISLLEEVPTN
ncbi:hypothetical protein IWT25_02332 [Secundilactobacillus pentosiphilus]|uniref:Uncharacterized protein n=1 Tax=Secundilactobacillus pentosiphilus TaxID=1714682 RepID=A0A1Z5IYW5_9LACO|nr:hypothetical protein [Secundilactobacillus pentosiphilus]GAX06984.1 hypothetical protein IWT25_02332 [Secundilactobacillus pentosiphilus]